LATLRGYGFGWNLGPDQLRVVSVGTGMWRVKHDASQLIAKPAAENAVLSLLSLMDDCASHTELMMQWLSESPTARSLDSEVGSLLGDLLGGGDPWLSYVRYNAPIELDWLTEHMPEAHLDAARLDGLRAMDQPASLELLGKIGDAAAKQVRLEHLG
jgi:hypothetical protein